ncbi:restriction endonuclease subunit S [Microcoleus sp. Pol7_A1]|uniref:restriction endonuclease subunit S n=1 Tax=Microcoleus sp. Pol7_A1 TaxID=2818893 RepID=UPI002FD126E4
MVKTLNFQFCKLTFIKTDNEELNQLENTILMRAIFNEYNQPLPLKKALSKTQYGFSASAQNSGNCRLLRITDIKEDGIDWDTVPFCDCNEIEKYRLNEKDILITRTGGTTGKTTLIQEIKETSIFASYLIRLSISEDYNPEYIYLFLNSYLFWNQILDLKNGTAQPNVNANKMTTIIFPSCPKEIQDKIVEYKKDKAVQISVLKQVQSDFQKINISHKNLKSIIIENEKQSDIISQLKQAILQEAISGQLTAEWRKQNPIQKGNPDTDAAALLAKIKAEKQQLIADGKLKKEKPIPEVSPDEIPFSLPDSWVWCRLGDICETLSTGPFGMMLHKSDYEDNGIPVVNPTNIVKGVIFAESKMLVSEKTVQRLSQYKLHQGDIVIARRGNLEKCAVVQNDQHGWLCGTGSFFMRLIIIYNDFFVMAYCSKKSQAYLLKDSIGQTMNNLNQKLLIKMLIPLPPLAEQKAIVEKVDYLMKIIDQLEAQIKHRKQLAEDLMQTVLREAFE